MASQKMRAKEALAFVKDMRPRVDPNRAFARQLALFEKMDCKFDPENYYYKTYLSWAALDKADEFLTRDHYVSDIPELPPPPSTGLSS